MACANPLTLKNPHFDKTGKLGGNFAKKYYSVPCGWCLNCRVDKRNYLQDCCEYEFNNYGCGAFVTFTYDDNHLYPLLKKNQNNEINATLCRSDYVHFLYRLRSKLNYYNSNNKLINKNFKYLVVGEYGGKFQRPHFHILFFGLDYMACEKLFLDCWQNGLIDSLPIKNGCFKYVLKYLDKQAHGNQEKQLYQDNGLEPPFMTHSTGFGKGLYLQQKDYIKSHNFCYRSQHNIDRPIPNYWRNKLFGRVLPDLTNICRNMEMHNITKDFKQSRPYSIQKINEFRHSQAKLREQNLINNALSNGQPVSQVRDSMTLDEIAYIDKLSTIALNESACVPF